MSEIKTEVSTITDTLDKIHKTKDGITCCGGIMKMIMHIDGIDFYEYQYKCECGNVITMHYKRDEEDIMW